MSRKKKNRLKMIKILQKNKNKGKQRNAEKGVENGTKYIINQKTEFRYQLVKNLRNSYKKRIKKLMMIKTLVMQINKKNQKNVDAEEENGIKLIMRERMKF